MQGGGNPQSPFKLPGDPVNRAGVSGGVLRRGLRPTGHVGNRLRAGVKTRRRQGHICRRLGDNLRSGTAVLAVVRPVHVSELVDEHRDLAIRLERRQEADHPGPVVHQAPRVAGHLGAPLDSVAGVGGLPLENGQQVGVRVAGERL